MTFQLGKRLLTCLGVVGLVVVLLPLAAAAADWASHRLGTAHFEAPADWRVTAHQRDRRFDFSSPDGRFELWAEWWLQDEPLLGWSDIVAHKRLTIADKGATFVHSAAESSTRLTVVFDDKGKGGRQFKLSLGGTGVGLEEITPLFDEMLGRIRFGDAVQPRAAPPSVKSTIAPAPTPVPTADHTAYLPSPDEDEPRLWLGPLSFEAPTGWSVQPAVDERTLRLTRPDGRAEIVAVLWPADRPLPNEAVEVEFMVISGEPAQGLRQRTPKGDVLHVIFDEPLADGSRIVVTYRGGGPVADAGPILDLFFVSLDRNRRAPGAPLLPTASLANADPFAGIEMDSLLK